MVTALTVEEFAHVIFGMMWVGTSIYVEAVLVPTARDMRSSGAFRGMLPLFGRTSMFQTVSGVFVLLTGVVYLLVKYPISEILAPTGATVTPAVLALIGLVLVIVALANGMVFLKPTAMKIAKSSWPADPAAPVPEAVMGQFRFLARGASINTGIVIVVLLLMVMAGTGGI